MNEPLLLSLIAPHYRAASEKGNIPPVIGVQSNTRWQGPESVQLGEERFRVLQCDSVLQVRDILETSNDGHLIFVTALDNLGADVEARLLRQRLLRIEPWDLLRTRFGARSFDAALRGKGALAEAALESLGATQPDPAPAGVLTEEAVWKFVLESRLNLNDARADARTWLEWSMNPHHVNRWRSISSDLRALLQNWLSTYLEGWAPAFLGCLESGYGQNAMAIGLALDVLRQEVADPQAQIVLAQARGRLEQYTGGRAISPQASRIWAEAAAQWASTRCAVGNAAAVAAELAEADRLLEKIGALPFAALGNWSRTGFEQRLESFSAALSSIIRRQSASKDLGGLLEDLSSHEAPKWYTSERTSLEKARMAARLRRWILTPERTIESWSAAVDEYTNASAWADLARQRLLHGNEPEAIARSWDALSDKVSKRRERENLAFAKELAKATSGEHVSEAAIPVEEILERIVAPWAKEKVLLVVMDGMSYAVWHEIQCEVQGRVWQSRSWHVGASLPPAITVIPSATSFSRCSLLCGQLAIGGQSTEKKGFAENRALLAVSKASFPPMLFHKDEVGSGTHNISEVLRDELQNEHRRIIGVVVNVIDDSLTGPEQRLFHWTLDQIPVLRTLLREAEEGGRTVVITSDHGHVLDRGVVMRRGAATDRYRAADMQATTEDEVLLAGKRVLDGSGRVVALASEKIRYSSVRKLGYHGGASPQECLVPVVVLTPGNRMVEGWYEAMDSPPLWWFETSDANESPAVEKIKFRLEAPTPLFDGVSRVERDWVIDLIKSETFTNQMQVAGGRLEAPRIEETIRVLASRNGVLMKAALAQKLGMPLLRIDGYLSNLQRVLNVEGYPVVAVDSSQTVRLDIGLLKTQFEVE